MNELLICHETDDAELLRMIRNHDVRAFDILYKRYWRPLLRFVSRYFEDADTCEEIVQDFFVHLHSRRDSLNIRLSVSSYFYTALRNRIFNYMRNRAVYRKHTVNATGNITAADNNVEQFIDKMETEKTINRLLQQMPIKYREVYMLRNQEDFTVKRIATVLNRPVDTIEKQMRKANAFLRDRLKESRFYRR